MVGGCKSATVGDLGTLRVMTAEWQSQRLGVCLVVLLSVPAKMPTAC